jgi:hypothetical protein
MADFVDAPTPFFDERRWKAAAGIEAGILNRLHLHKMPTDEQIGLSTVFHLADDIASGETFHPSGGLKFDRSVTEGELLLGPDRESLASLEGKRVVLIGDAMREELSAIGEGFLGLGVSSLVVLTQSQEAQEEILHNLQPKASIDVDVRVIGNDVEEALDDLLQNHGGFDVVVSAPFARLPFNPLAAESRQQLGARAVPRGLRQAHRRPAHAPLPRGSPRCPGAELPDRAADARHLLRLVPGGVRPGAVRQELPARVHGHPWRGDASACQRCRR